MWEKVTGKKFGVAMCNFKSDIYHSLSLSVGDRIHIKQENGEWLYGHVSTNAKVMGLFPASHVHIIDVPNTDKPSQTSYQPNIETPILEEVVVVLKEWAEIIRGLFTNPTFQSQKLPDMRGTFKKLADLRRDILSGQLTIEIQKDSKRMLIQLIAQGNNQLQKCFENIKKETGHYPDQPLIGLIPTVDGDVVDIRCCSVVQLYKIHSDCNKDLFPAELKKYARRSAEVPAIFNIHFHLNHFGCGVQDDAEVYFCLYDASEKKYLCERFLCKFDRHGTPLDRDNIGNIMSVFTDLSLQDLSKALYLTCHIVRQGNFPAKASKRTGYAIVRKPYGCGVENLQDLLQNVSIDTKDTDKKQFNMKIFSGDENDFYQQHEQIIKKTDKAGKQGPANIGIKFHLQVMQGTFESLILSRKVSRVRKLGFSEFINPDDVRNDLFVILDRGSFDKITRHVEVTVAAVDGVGKTIDCICFTGCNQSLDRYESFILNGSTLRWNENIKFQIPANFADEKQMHIRFEFRTISPNRSTKKLFAIAFIRLTKDDDTTVENGEHDLFVYRCQDQTYLNPSNYIELPATELELRQRSTHAHGNSNFTKNVKDSFIVVTSVYSTKLTQNGDVVQLLKWRQNKHRLETIVDRLHNVKGEDIVVVLSDILDSLFEILDLKKPSLEKPVFRALVYIINTLNDKRYKSFTSVLDSYLNGPLFSSSTVHFFLLTHLTENINKATQEPQFVQDMLMGLQHFFKLIFMSHSNLQSTQVVDQLDIVEKIRALIGALNILMSSTETKLEELQLIVLQNAVTMYSEMMNKEIYIADEVCQFTVDALESTNRKGRSQRLLRAKLNCILDTVRSSLYQEKNARSVFLGPIVPQLTNHLAKREAVEECVDILSEMISSLQCIANEIAAKDQDAAKGKLVIDEDIMLISRLVLENLLNILNDRSGDTASIESTKAKTCLLTLLNIMEQKHYDQYRSQFKEPAAKQHFLSKIYNVFNDICRSGTYPEKKWVILKMVCNRILLKAVKYFSEDLPQAITDNGSLDVWKDFFHLSVTFVTQNCLQLEEKYTSAKMEQLKSKFGDLRFEMVELIALKWNSLGVHQLRLATDQMIKYFLDVSLVPEANIRRTVLPLLFDIMRWEWNEKRDLSMLEMVLIDTVDERVCRSSKGDERYARIFAAIFTQKLSTEPWREVGLQLVSKVSMLFERLIDYRVSLQQKDNRYLRLSATHSLIDFYKNVVEREEIYTRNISSLSKIHLEVQDYYEAACTVELRAKTLNWTDNKISGDGLPPMKEYECKELLYEQILDYVDKGQVWEFGIPILKELEKQYEMHFFDYAKLSQVLRKRSEFYDKIIRTDRQSPVYFKVDFYGSFPYVRSTNKNQKSFIFKGGAFDKSNSMLEKFQSDFPKAKSWGKSQAPSESEIAENQYIEIRKVDPVPSVNETFRWTEDVPQEIVRYYNKYKIKEFKYDRPFNRGVKDKENEFKTLWLGRTVVTTVVELPNLLGWSEIIDVKMYELTPLEKAVEDVEIKIQEITNITKYYRSHRDAQLSPYTQCLQGTIDASVMGGLQKLREAFLSSEYKEEHPEDRQKLDHLTELIIKQLYILDEALTLHGSLIPGELQDLQDLLGEKMKEQFTKAGLSKKTRRASTPSLPSQFKNQARTKNRTASSTQAPILNRTTSQFYLPMDNQSPLSKPERVSGISITSTIPEEPERLSVDSSSSTRDSGMGAFSESSMSEEGPQLPPRQSDSSCGSRRPDSSGSTSSLGSSNFSSSGNSRPPSSETELLDEKRSGLATVQRPITLPFFDDTNGGTSAEKDRSPSPPPLPVKKTSMRLDSETHESMVIKLSPPPLFPPQSPLSPTPKSTPNSDEATPPPLPSRPAMRREVKSLFITSPPPVSPSSHNTTPRAMKRSGPPPVVPRRPLPKPSPKGDD